MSAFAEPGCGAKEAALIRHALQQINYNFDAVDPHNGMSPSSILQTLLSLSYPDLTRAVAQFNGISSKMGNLGALVGGQYVVDFCMVDFAQSKMDNILPIKNRPYNDCPPFRRRRASEWSALSSRL